MKKEEKITVKTITFHLCPLNRIFFILKNREYDSYACRN